MERFLSVLIFIYESFYNYLNIFFLLQGGAIAGNVAHILDSNHGKVSFLQYKGNVLLVK